MPKSTLRLKALAHVYNKHENKEKCDLSLNHGMGVGPAQAGSSFLKAADLLGL